MSAKQKAMNVFIKRKVKYYDSGSYSRSTAKAKRDYRIGLITFFFVIFFVLIVGRLYKLQILGNKYYLALASGQHEIFKQLYPERGVIYVHDPEGELVKGGERYYPMAANKNLNLLFSVPKEITDVSGTLKVLAEVFGMKAEETNSTQPVNSSLNEIKTDEVAVDVAESEAQKKLYSTWQEQLAKKDDPYEPLKHLVSDEIIEKIKTFNLTGIRWTKEVSRFYPEKNIASQLIGFVGKQAENNLLKGYYGLEGCYNKELSGVNGFLRSELDSVGRQIAVADNDFREAEDGQDLILTIDKSIQFFACDELNKAVVQTQAEAGSLIAMEPATGKIMAICNSPDFDPNEYNTVDEVKLFNNNAIMESFEPGSVIKAITMAAALDTGKVDPLSGYEDTGKLMIAGHAIMNSDKLGHGWQTMTQVLEKSLNTGAVFAARQVGLDEFKRYFEGFGFGKKTGIDLCGEASGDLSLLDNKNEIYMATASFGQGITINLLQLVRAYGAIANDGQLVEPYVVEKIIDKAGKVIQQKEPKVVSQIISKETAKLLGSMLVSVVKNGHSKAAGIKGYLVGGKTGTAQVPDLKNGGYSDKTIHTFVGFAPFNQPVVVMAIKLDNPKTARFAESTAVPVFSTVGKFILDYYQIPPEVK